MTTNSPTSTKPYNFPVSPPGNDHHTNSKIGYHPMHLSRDAALLLRAVHELQTRNSELEAAVAALSGTAPFVGDDDHAKAAS